MAIQGRRYATSDVNGGVSDLRYWRNVDPMIRKDMAPITPLTSLLRAIKGRSKPTKNIKFEFMSRQGLPQTVTSNAIEDAVTDISFGAGQFELLRAKDQLFNHRTEEIVRVNTTPTSAGDVDVTRGYNGTTAAATVAGDVWQRLSNSQEEWSDVGDMIGLDPDTDFNYVQTIRMPFGVSGHARRIAKAKGMIGPGEMEYLDYDTYRDTLLRGESSLVMGSRGKTADDYSTGGLKQFLTKAGSAAYNEDVSAVPFVQSTLDDYIYELSRKSTKKVWTCVCGLDLPNLVTGWARDKVRINQALRKFGMFVTQYDSPHGRVNFVPHPLFQDTGWSDDAWFLDMDSIRMRGFKGMMDPIVYKGPTGKGMQGNGVDGLIYEYRYTLGLELTEAWKCGVMTGIGNTLP